jgi:putative oxidoreductase
MMPRWLVTGLRLFLAADLLLNGVNFWLHFLPITVPDSIPARALMDGLIASGLFNFVKYIEIASGLALLVNRYVPLALIVMLPLTVVIFWVDCVLIRTPEGFLFGGTTAVVHGLLMLAYFKYYQGLLIERPEPIPGAPSGNPRCRDRSAPGPSLPMMPDHKCCET